MKKVRTLFGLGLLWLGLTAGAASAQSCAAYFPMKAGAKFELSHYNEKDKVTSVVNTAVVEKSRTGNILEMTAQCVASDAKGKEINKYDYTVSCNGEEFHMDMRAMGNQNQQQQGIENMEIKVESEDMKFPAKLTPGTTLPDAHIKMVGTMNGMTIMNTTTTVTNRKCTGTEKVTVAAGTFDCVIVEEDCVVSMMGMNMDSHNKTWYSLGVGIVKSEYSRKGKPSGRSELTQISGN